ncbi:MULTISPECIES: hypothetical protein [Cysteiniphilum]|uniref:Uncharacterized protein n=1 Tax=Cysteiniphilum litorale TaxID=2056700 RepID=A0A8J3E8K1_9GAMM|nr:MULTISPECIES: hypothetical protein [Cysteiniphilum]GGF92092.1 hypothetical protein GCM10010995_06560 [Cysteiniphilum litorale]
MKKYFYILSLSAFAVSIYASNVFMSPFLDKNEAKEILNIYDKSGMDKMIEYASNKGLVVYTNMDTQKTAVGKQITVLKQITNKNVIDYYAIAGEPVNDTLSRWFSYNNYRLATQFSNDIHVKQTMHYEGSIISSKDNPIDLLLGGNIDKVNSKK